MFELFISFWLNFVRFYVSGKSLISFSFSNLVDYVFKVCSHDFLSLVSTVGMDPFHPQLYELDLLFWLLWLRICCFVKESTLGFRISFVVVVVVSILNCTLICFFPCTDLGFVLVFPKSYYVSLYYIGISLIF